MGNTRLLFVLTINLAALAFGGEWPSYMHVYKGSTPLLDGSISKSEYGDATVFYGVKNWNERFAKTPVTNRDDLSLIGWVKHDGENLYFAFDITDDVLYGYETERWTPDENPVRVHDFTKESYPWFGDGVELLINASNTWETEDNTFNYGDARSWQVVCNHSKSLLGGIGQGGLIQGEQRTNPVAWLNHEKWIRSGAMKAVTKAKPDNSGYIVEWMITPECLEVDNKGTKWSHEHGTVKMGLNIAVQDLDNREKSTENWGRFHHEVWWAGEPDKSTWPKQWGTMYVHPEPMVKELFVNSEGKTNNPGTKDSPLYNIEAARDKIRIMKNDDLTGEVVVWLRGGRYEIESPILFTCFDSGSKNLKITYKAWPGEEPVISGGKILQGTWEKYKGNIWSLDLPVVREQQWWFRQLFKDGKRQIRSRYPNDGKFLTVEKIKKTGESKDPLKLYIDRDLPFENLSRKEAEAVLYNIWSIARARIWHTQENLVQTYTPLGWMGLAPCSVQTDSKIHLEHAFDLIDIPGEWYLDRDNFKLFYMAKDSENPNNSQWIAPFSKQLMRVQGRKDQPISNLKFEGITFEHAAWQMPLGGYAGIQAGFYGTRRVSMPSYAPPMAIICEYTSGCTFDNIELRHTGTGGIGLGAGCMNTIITSSKLDDIGSTGILVGWQKIADEPPRRAFESGWSDFLEVPKKNKIVHNELSNCGQVHLSATAVMAAFTEDTLIAHNDIHDMPHIGITVGFIWADNPTTHKRTIVEYNHIYNCMKRLSDGAGIYALGYQPGTIIRNNYIHDILNGHGLYTDQGSAHVLFENNICYRMGLRGYNHNYGHHNILRNNMFIYPCLSAERKIWGKFENANFMIYPKYLEATVVRRNRGDFDVDGSFRFEQNIVLFDKGEYFNSGFGKESDTFYMDNNLIWNPSSEITFNGGESFEKFQQRGHDRNSIVADPMFVDLEHGNFSLKKGSPAFKIGFKEIDISKIGPQE